MKISVDNVPLFELSEVQENVIKDYIPEDIFDADMKRRLQWVLTHLYDECFIKLKSEWDQKLIANGVKSVPTDPDEYAKLVFSQPNYMNRSARDKAVQ